MDAMILFGKWIARLVDGPLGWLLAMDRDLAVLIVAVGTSVILTIARVLTTNQDLMRRCKFDLARLKQLKKQAKARRDKPAVRRINTTVGMIQMTRMKAEGWGLLASLLPILLLASWAFERLDYLPPKVGDEVTVKATFPVTARNEPAWLIVEPDGPVQPANGLVRKIVKDPNIHPLTGSAIPSPVENGLAEWKLKVVQPADSVRLLIHYNRRQVEHPLRVGRPDYADVIRLHNERGDPPWPDCSTQVVLRQAWFLDRVPGVGRFWKWWLDTGNLPVPAAELGFFKKVKLYGWSMPLWLLSRVTLLAPWLTAYLVIAIIFVPLLRKVLRVY